MVKRYREQMLRVSRQVSLGANGASTVMDTIAPWEKQGQPESRRSATV